MAYQGGPVLSTPHVYLVWWGWGNSYNTDTVVVPNVNAFARGIGGTPSLGILNQYWQGSAWFDNLYDIVKGVWFDNTNALPANPWSPTYTPPQEAVRAAQHFGTASDSNALYVILIPTRPNGSGGTYYPTSYNARHGYTADGSYTIYYTDFPYQPDSRGYSYPGSTQAEETTRVYEHELAEAITDPYDSSGHLAWVDANNCEVGDKCSEGSDAPLPRYDTTSPTYFGEAKLWSNEAWGGSGGCVDTYRWRANFFAKASNGYLYEQYQYDGFSGSGWTLMPSQPNTWVSDPAVTSWGTARLDLFVTDGSGYVRSGYSTNGGASMGWGNWGRPADNYPSYTVVSSPAVVSFKRYSLDVFVTACTVGAPSYCRLFRKYYEHDPATNSTTYSAWLDVGAPSSGTFSGPGALAGVRGEQSLDVWIRNTVWGGVWRAYSDNRGGSWTWESWGTPFALGSGKSLVGDPDAVTEYPGDYSVVIGDSTGALWQGYSGPYWFSLGEAQGHVINYSVGAVSMGTDRFRVYANASNNVYQFTTDFYQPGWDTEWPGYYTSGLAASAY